MATLQPYWQLVYRSDRRKHSHRCQACRKIVAEGSEVLMARVELKKTHVLHLACADIVSFDGFTHRQYLAAGGSKKAREWLDQSPMSKPRGQT